MVDSSKKPQAKIILFPLLDCEWVENQLKDCVSTLGLEVFNIFEPGSMLGERRLGIADGGAFDIDRPCPLFILSPSVFKLVDFFGSLSHERAMQFAKDASELFVHAHEAGAVFFIPDEAWSEAIELLPWLRIHPPTKENSIVTSSRPVLTGCSAVVAAALELYATGGGIGEVVDWGVDLFFVGEGSSFSRREDGAVDLTGPPRKLVQGPFIFLAPGTWEIRVRFSVDAAAANFHYRIEWGQPGVFSNIETTIDRAGIYEAVLSHRWETGAAAEFIFELLESSMGGYFSFIGATVTRTE